MLEARGLDGAVVRNWMRSAGIDGDDARLQAEAEEIVQVVADATHLAMDAPRASHFAGRQRGQQASYAAKPYIAQPIAVFFWFLVWIIGLLRLSVQPRQRAVAPV